MRIAVCVWFFPKLSETFVLNQIQFLEKRGHQVFVFACFDPSTHMAMEDYEPELVRHPYAEELLRRGRVYYIDHRRPRFFWKTVESVNVAILHFQFPDLADCFLSCAPRHHRWKVVTTVHNLSELTTKSSAKDISRAMRYCLRRSHMILSTSFFVQHQLYLLEEYLGIKTTPAHIIHHMGVDTELFKSYHRPGKRVLTFAFVGRFVEKKGIDDALSAFASIRRAGVDARFIVAGGGVGFSHLKHAVMRLGCGRFVEFLPKLTQLEARRVLEQADIFLHPSKTAPNGDQEGIPVAIMEASAMELPIVSTFHTGIPELVVHNTSGLLAAEGDISILSRHLKLLAGDSKLRQFYGRNGRAIVLRNFNVREQVQKLEKYYELAKNANDRALI